MKKITLLIFLIMTLGITFACIPTQSLEETSRDNIFYDTFDENINLSTIEFYIPTGETNIYLYQTDNEIIVNTEKNPQLNSTITENKIKITNTSTNWLYGNAEIICDKNITRLQQSLNEKDFNGTKLNSDFNSNLPICVLAFNQLERGPNKDIENFNKNFLTLASLILAIGFFFIGIMIKDTKHHKFSILFIGLGILTILFLLTAVLSITATLGTC